MTIGYLVSQYPAASHTFIRREVGELRRQGLDVQTFSIRRPATDERLAADDRQSFEQTTYILAKSFGAFAAAHIKALLSRPARYGGTFALALSHRAPGLKNLLWSVFHFAEAIVLASELKRKGVRHLHNHFANSGATVGFLAAHFARLPWSLTLHGISETDYPAGLLLGRKIAAAEFVACVSYFGRAQAMRLCDPGDWHKLRIVRCGIDLPVVPKSRAADKDAIQIVCVGRLSAEKGHVGLLEAFRSVRERGHYGARLVLVGSGPERERLEALAVSLGIGENVEFAGRLDERAALAKIAQSDLLVLPSLMEGLPVVLMEAMAAGIPVIAPRLAGIPELIEHEVNGLLFRPSDWRGLAENMALMLEDEDARLRMAARGRETVAGEFTIEHAVVPLLAHFADRAPNLPAPSPS